MDQTIYQNTLVQARRFLHGGQYAQAAQLARTLQTSRPRDPAVLSLLSAIAAALANFPEAIKFGEQCVSASPSEIGHRLALGRLCVTAGRFKRAAQVFEECRNRFPKDPRPSAGLAETYERAGDTQAAREILAPYFSKGAETPHMAHLMASMDFQDGRAQAAVDAMSRHKPDPRSAGGWYYLLGRALERLDRFDDAWEAYTTANRRESAPFDMPGQLNQISSLLRHFTRSAIERAPRATDTSMRPIFLVGRPRSGTTLMQTVLGAHPQVVGLGENMWLLEAIRRMPTEAGVTLGFPECIGQFTASSLNKLGDIYRAHVKRAAPDAHIIVDKTLYNYKFVGLAALLFPDARFIYCRRNVTDMCFAAYAEDLQTHAYARDLQQIGIMQRLFERMMRHWEEVLDRPILSIDYEAFVDDQAAVTRGILDFCGLDWNDACLNYHSGHAKPGLRDSVASPTLSYSQIRKPIFRSSLGRAAKFQKHLGPLQAGLDEGDKIVERIDSDLKK